MGGKSQTAEDSSMGDALKKRKRQRGASEKKAVTGDGGLATLSVVGERTEEETDAQPSDSTTSEVNEAALLRKKPNWVRHTVGLWAETKLKLQDAAASQKEKERHGKLAPGEPANEQEIVELGVSWALDHIGFKR